MTESVTTDKRSPSKQSPSGAFRTGAPSVDTRPVGDDDRAMIAVFGDLDGAQDAVERLAAAGFPVDRISIIGKDLQCQIRVNGLVTTGNVVLGPLAVAAVGAAEGVLIAGGVGAVLGHFVSKKHIPKYEGLVHAGSYLAVVQGGEDDVARAQQILTESGSTDVQR